jgi:cyclohexanone monooxygenase
VTGALLKADITGRDGQPLREAWQEAPANYLGVQVHGFPNLFTVTGPGSPSALANMIVHIEQHIDWIGDCIDYVRQSGKQTIEPTKQSMVDWMVEVSDAAKGTMYVSPGCHSWYLGHNVPGKPGVFLPYIGGFRKYIERCDWEAENGYPSFELR